ncbi:hypothetical protein V7S43_017087 [Phytophthora oleae]|uniref:Uncharacterized protein n=1 Tax=Phytophthora oleae TaxID=2107226 RepID=A0ABD3ETS6_9STRA
MSDRALREDKPRRNPTKSSGPKEGSEHQPRVGIFESILKPIKCDSFCTNGSLLELMHDIFYDSTTNVVQFFNSRKSRVLYSFHLPQDGYMRGNSCRFQS